MTGEHVVETLHWEVAFSDEEQAFEWQPRLAALLRGPAVTLIDEVFGEVAGHAQVLALDTLEIDLGRLPREDIEQVLQDRLRARLREALQAQRAGARAGHAAQAALRAQDDNDGALLRHYLARGFLPWQAGPDVRRRLGELAEAASRQGAVDLATWLRDAPTAATARLARLLHPQLALARARVGDALLAQSPLAADARESWTQLVLCDPAGLIDLAARYGQAARVRRRMAREFGEGLLLDLVGLLVPTERDFIAGVISQANLFAAAMRPPLPAAQMPQRLWEFTLAYLLVDRGSEFNRRAYIASLLRRSAQHDGVDESLLLRSLIEALADAGAGTLQRQMLDLLHAIAREDERRAARSRRREGASREQRARPDGHRERIRAALWADTPVSDDIRAAWAHVADHDAAWLAAETTRQGQSARVRTRMARDFGSDLLLRLVHVLVPTEHDFIAAVTSEAATFAQAASPPVPEDRMRVRLWEFTLAYLLVRRGSEFNRRSYLASLLRRWAEHDGTGQRALLQALIAGLLGIAASAMRRQMLALLLDLQSGTPAPAVAAARPGTSRWRELALPRLRFDWQAALTMVEWRDHVWDAWDTLSLHDAAWLREQTRHALQSQRTRRAWTAAGSRQLARVVDLFAPGEGVFVESVIDQAAPLAWSDAPDRARGRLWDVTLAILTADRGSEFNRRSYLAALLAHMARSEGIAYRELLSSLQEGLCAVAAASGIQRQLLQLTRSLLEEFDPRAVEDDENAVAHHVSQAIAHADHDELLTLLDEPDRAVRAALEQALRSPQAAERLAPRLADPVLTRLLFALRPREHDVIERVARQFVIACAQLRVGAPARLEALKKRFLLHYLFVQGRSFSVADFARRFAAWLEGELRIKDAAAWRAAIAQETAKSPRDAGQAVGRAIAAALRTRAAERSAQAAQCRRGEEPRPGEPIYVANAGIVLAQPFLARLFEMRGLVESGAFRDAAAAARAVALLQWFATGQGAFAEHEVVLNKLLCGLPVAEPLAWQGELEEADRAAADSLLAAMVQQWKALGTTSPQGLRETFLRREGRLVDKSDAWQLLVQPGPYDMLIDAIPWGFALVKFPWMERMLHVQWR